MVVDFSVDHQDGTVVAQHGLLAGGEVKDGQPRMGKANFIVRPHVVGVGTSVGLKRIHSVENISVGLPQHPTDAAHESSTSPAFLKKCSKT